MWSTTIIRWPRGSSCVRRWHWIKLTCTEPPICLFPQCTSVMWTFQAVYEADKAPFYQWVLPEDGCLWELAPPTGHLHELHFNKAFMTPAVQITPSTVASEHFSPSSSLPGGRRFSRCQEAAARWDVEEGGCREPPADPEGGAGVPEEHPQWGSHISPLHFYFYRVVGLTVQPLWGIDSFQTSAFDLFVSLMLIRFRFCTCKQGITTNQMTNQSSSVSRPVKGYEPTLNTFLLFNKFNQSAFIQH